VLAEVERETVGRIRIAGCTVRELLGHADTTMVLRYAHLSPDHLAEAVEKVARSVRTGGQPSQGGGGR
jgi:integrase